MKYFFALLAIVGGSLMIMKSSWFVESFGRSEWGEHYLGGGGTYTMYKLIGLAIIIIAVFAVTGVMGEIILAIFGSMFGLK